MTYTVIWRLGAIRQLETVAANAADADAVRAAAARIDFALRRTPRDMGESRSPGYRLWYEDVLGVFYRIDEDNNRVDVIFAGPARRR
jgi:hypothetical protein